MTTMTLTTRPASAARTLPRSAHATSRLRRRFAAVGSALGSGLTVAFVGTTTLSADLRREAGIATGLRHITEEERA